MTDGSYKLTLHNGWMATFSGGREFRMGAYRWGLILFSPDGKRIGYLGNDLILVNSKGIVEENEMLSSVVVSEDGKYGHIIGAYSEWIVDFENCKIAPYRISIDHRHKKEFEDVLVVNVFEQPAYKGANEHLNIKDKHFYITFPFGTDEEIKNTMDEYLEIRRRQLDEVYFNIRN